MNKIISKILKRKVKLVWDLGFLRRLRELSDGLSIFEFNINLDLYKEDHNPKLDIHLNMFNYRIFYFEVYNVLHEEEQ
jgi:hypothetical protein